MRDFDPVGVLHAHDRVMNYLNQSPPQGNYGSNLFFSVISVATGIFAAIDKTAEAALRLAGSPVAFVISLVNSKSELKNFYNLSNGIYNIYEVAAQVIGVAFSLFSIITLGYALRLNISVQNKLGSFETIGASSNSTKEKNLKDAIKICLSMEGNQFYNRAKQLVIEAMKQNPRTIHFIRNQNNTEDQIFNELDLQGVSYIKGKSYKQHEWEDTLAWEEIEENSILMFAHQFSQAGTHLQFSRQCYPGSILFAAQIQKTPYLVVILNPLRFYPQFQREQLNAQTRNWGSLKRVSGEMGQQADHQYPDFKDHYVFGDYQNSEYSREIFANIVRAWFPALID